ncbi:hypothetical protein PYW07_010963 [Mythimna separata]|uniref:Uncharacterized protein n=1 Tax=Mythimna separata TaxID=271217 RepID=A0AAD8DKV8_MYTSE|nr:hypothetical protein PYW07_010963 [Mythimna separata]
MTPVGTPRMRVQQAASLTTPPVTRRTLKNQTASLRTSAATRRTSEEQAASTMIPPDTPRKLWHQAASPMTPLDTRRKLWHQAVSPMTPPDTRRQLEGQVVSPMTPVDTRRMSEAQAASLRRQLMRDNYDYSHPEEEWKQPNGSARGDNTANVYYQKGAHYVPASEIAKSDSGAYSAEQDQNQPSGQREQDEPHEQDGRYEPDDQYEPPAGQQEQTRQYEHHAQREQYGQEEQNNQYTRPKKPTWSEQEQPGQPGQFHGQDQAQYEQQVERDRPSYAGADEPAARDGSEPKYAPEQRDADLARRHIDPQQAAYSPTYQMQREVYNPYGGGGQQARPFGDLRGNFKEQPARTFGDLRGNFEEQPARTSGDLRGNFKEQPARTFGDLRGDFKEQQPKPFRGLRRDPKEQYEQINAEGQLVPEGQADDKDYYREDQEAIDQQNISDSKDDGTSDYSQSKKQSREQYDAFGHTTRVQRLHHTGSPAARAPAQRGRDALNYRDPYQQPERSRFAPQGRNPYESPGLNHDAPRGSNHYEQQSRDQYARPSGNRYEPSGRDHYRPPQSARRPPQNARRPPLEHNISKKDLLYYMDDTRLRRRDDEMSPDVPDEEERPSLRRSAGPNRSRPTPSNPRAQSTERARKSFVITVAPGNVTYKLLTLKTRKGGRRRGERRIVEERGPGGVAIISLDHAPLPSFRLPRSRRQFMHNHHHAHHQPA